MLNPFLERLDPQTRLLALYDAAASGWQNGLDRLGYTAAYADFMERAVPRPQGPVGVIIDVGTGSGAFAKAFTSQRREAGGVARSGGAFEAWPLLRNRRRKELTARANPA